MTTPEELAVAVEFMKEKINAVDARSARIENKVDELSRRVLSREGMELVCGAKHDPLAQRVGKTEQELDAVKKEIEPLKKFMWTATGLAIGGSTFVTILGILLEHYLSK
jgi:DNA repair exonuclease SbcCD ATPase subunit